MAVEADVADVEDVVVEAKVEVEAVEAYIGAEVEEWDNKVYRTDSLNNMDRMETSMPVIL